MTKVQAPRGVTLRTEEKFEEVRQLISIGRQRGYLVHDEVNDILPEEISTSVEEIEKLLAASNGLHLVRGFRGWFARVGRGPTSRCRDLRTYFAEPLGQDMRPSGQPHL